MKRILVVDRQSDYTNEEIQAIQQRLNQVSGEINVYRDLLNSGEMVLCAHADIRFSYEEVCGMVGEAYIDGVSG